MMVDERAMSIRSSASLMNDGDGENEFLVPGERRFNWVWYVNYDETTELPRVLTDKNGKQRDYSIPPGMMADDVEREMRQYAQRVLVEPCQKLIAATSFIRNRSPQFGNDRRSDCFYFGQE